ncbi:MAG: hypothetical protein HYY24_14425 [Verrucomicrobia bacterium]|nr:hypothetical protein [Verrucomicrobiota bacterium]
MTAFTLYYKVSAVEQNWAAEHLQVIRTLMERAAIYRRALAPVMLLTGGLGLVAAALGIGLKIDSPRGFIGYWMALSLLPLAGSYILVRRQSLRDGDPFWSPPTRRVTQALLPPLGAGLVAGLVLLIHMGHPPPGAGAAENVVAMLWLPLAWIVLYGCAMHAAGFFMPRGMKIFGWAFILGGCGFFALGIPDAVPRHIYAHGLMGFFFGALHLAYGGYLYFTEKRKNEA